MSGNFSESHMIYSQRTENDLKREGEVGTGHGMCTNCNIEVAIKGLLAYIQATENNAQKRANRCRANRMRGLHR